MQIDSFLLGNQKINKTLSLLLSIVTRSTENINHVVCITEKIDGVDKNEFAREDDYLKNACLLKTRGFKFEVQQPEVAWCSVIPPRRIPHAGF